MDGKRGDVFRGGVGDQGGRDEIVYGAAVIDDNGRGLWTTGLGHGDAAHLGDLDPSRPGPEYLKVFGEASKPGSWFADARTGQRLWQSLRNTKGEALSRKPSSSNFLIRWDGDPTRTLLLAFSTRLRRA